MSASLTPPLEPDALGEIVARLAPRLRSLALRYVRDADAAGDVVQSAFEKALRHAGQFRGHAQPATWLHRVVVNEALMWLRSERRRQRRTVACNDAVLDAAPDAAPLALETLLRRETRARVRRAVAALGERDREVLERSALAGIGTVSYAHAEGLDPATVKSRAHRARRRLAALLRAAG